MRWACILGALGHSVKVREAWPGTGRPDAGARGPDLLVAIHAWRSATSVAAFRARYPARSLVVLMSGTDIYRFQHSHREETAASMEAADRLVGLHDLVGDDLPPRFRGKLRIIHQSALPLCTPRTPSRRTFDVCVVGHLREEKDPFRAARAARLAPGASRLRIIHLGKAHDAAHAREARAEMAGNPRYVWRGEVPRWQVRRTFARCHAMVMSSIMEGGANVVSEALVAGVPVIASDISGNLGLLGPDHPASYPAGDTEALAALLRRAETEPGFLDAVRAHGDARRDRFSPERERAAWAALLGELVQGGGHGARSSALPSDPRPHYAPASPPLPEPSNERSRSNHRVDRRRTARISPGPGLHRRRGARAARSR